ncbi:MAG TPA: IS481 family transposase [Mycobacteriales bacterium]|nr:IS481 family transposase [Mycobacteriales bacterium]
MPHVNARTNAYGRNLAVQRYLAGHKVRDVAAQLGVSRTTVYKWIARFRAEGPAGLVDRSSRPRTSPRRTPLAVELLILAARLERHAGPVQLAALLGLPASTVGAVLRRWAVPHLVELDRITGELLRGRVSEVRYEHPRPGDLLHVDVKKLGRIPDGGGWRLDGADNVDHQRSKNIRTGFDYVHVAVDDHSRLAYAEVLTDEKMTTCAGFLHRAVAWFRDTHGVTVRRVLTDNAKAYRVGADWIWVCHALQIHRRFIKPGHPWTNGKAERFNRTLLTDWAYAQPWYSTTERNTAFDAFLDHYNTRRAHTAAGGRPPITRLAA